ncbi:hypothetical protein B0T26DRAFT_736067 [Lasiosphaeria miniovina]|uniref:DUF1993 domain-containing protein n=1 Tax=Lasiosphaeria miniovina TaxID=1954250 RepID=A0AA40EAL7_9PEZI|nr:uncharacterized protein B0T26DRAFT_736067 [Lasiosphaeria miniovina]KAK0732935.1 hypothetical protein B0T26DRAFT_736067 [Lasiosphaeria miniovina]
MSNTTLYETTIPTFIRGLQTLSYILAKAGAYADEHQISAQAVAGWALCDDMRPLSFQVQLASNTAKKSVERLTAFSGSPWPDDEDSLPRLAERVDKTIDFLERTDFAAINSPNPSTIHLVLKDRIFDFSREDYVLKYALPNFFFHVQTAYAILRMKGVQIGKFDYLNAFLKGDEKK